MKWEVQVKSPEEKKKQVISSGIRIELQPSTSDRRANQKALLHTASLARPRSQS
jgi:hypothetical protein